MAEKLVGCEKGRMCPLETWPESMRYLGGGCGVNTAIAPGLGVHSGGFSRAHKGISNACLNHSGLAMLPWADRVG